jgi:hypothetical protein
MPANTKEPTNPWKLSEEITGKLTRFLRALTAGRRGEKDSPDRLEKEEYKKLLKELFQYLEVDKDLKLTGGLQKRYYAANKENTELCEASDLHWEAERDFRKGRNTSNAGKIIEPLTKRLTPNFEPNQARPFDALKVGTTPTKDLLKTEEEVLLLARVAEVAKAHAKSQGRDTLNCDDMLAAEEALAEENPAKWGEPVRGVTYKLEEDLKKIVNDAKKASGKMEPKVWVEAIRESRAKACTNIAASTGPENVGGNTQALSKAIGEAGTIPDALVELKMAQELLSGKPLGTEQLQDAAAHCQKAVENIQKAQEEIA